MSTRPLLPAVLLLLAACAQNPPAQVVDMTRDIPTAGASSTVSPEQAQSAPDRYIVQKGDSLYSIAFHNHLDWQQVAAWNGIVAPYTIVPGQELRLTPPPGGIAGSPGVTTHGLESSPATTVVTTTAGTAASAAAQAEAPAQAPPSAPEPAPAATPAPQPSSGAGTAMDSGSIPEAATRNVAGITWRWPVHGKVLSTYVASDPTRQGIDIGGHRGTPVRAAGDGVVVYSGNGLVGYGELVIVKHSDTYLSAYGHNSKRLVKEGDRVKAGQEIATMGSSGTSRTELHFEIRKHGQPIDPMGFLPGA